MKLNKMALSAFAAIGIAAVPAQAPAQFDNSTITTIAAMLLADKLGLDPSMITGLLGGLGGSSGYGNSGGLGSLGGGGGIFDMASIFGLQQYAPQANISDLLRLRQQGASWDQIGNTAGISPSQMTYLRNSGQLDSNNVWRQTATTQLGLPPTTVEMLRNRGLTWKDITIASVISRESGRSIFEVSDRFRSTGDWNRVAQAYGVGQARVQNRVTNWRQTRQVPAEWRRPVNVREYDRYDAQREQARREQARREQLRREEARRQQLRREQARREWERREWEEKQKKEKKAKKSKKTKSNNGRWGN